MGNVHLQQSQSLTITQAMHQQQQQQQQQQTSMNNQLANNNQPTNSHSNSLASFNPQATDFSLEFLENLPTTDTTSFTDQELLNSFDTDSGFNLDF